MSLARRLFADLNIEILFLNRYALVACNGCQCRNLNKQLAFFGGWKDLTVNRQLFDNDAMDTVVVWPGVQTFETVSWVFLM